MMIANVITGIMACSMLLLAGCKGTNLSLGQVVNPAVASAVGFAAYEIAPDDWTQSEKVALGFGAAGASFIVGEIINGKIDADRIEAFDAGYRDGRAYGARRQYEIMQQLQKSTQQSSRRVKTYDIPAPVNVSVNQVPYTVKLEVQE